MSRSTTRRFIDLIASSGLATSLLIVVGAWSMLATVIPQGNLTNQKVIAWGRSHAAIEPVVKALGFHAAFTAPIFVACALALAVCTAACAWRRTRFAATKSGLLSAAKTTTAEQIAQRHDFTLAVDPSVSSEEALDRAQDALSELGLVAEKREGALVHASAAWTAWGSPVFHWALLALILSVVGGQLLRSEGLMGLGVGQTKPDTGASYGSVHTGPLHNWGAIHRSIRLDGFELNYTTAGVDRGPTPHVTVLDGSGHILASQRVYPNHTLNAGSLAIYPSDFGLSADVSLLNKAGQVTGRTFELMDFASNTPEGTLPVGGINVLDANGKPLMEIELTVPLDINSSGLGVKKVPAHPVTRVLVYDNAGKRILDRRVSVGGTTDLPDGSSLRLNGVNYYARLQVVDDGSITLLLAGVIVAMVGLAVAVFARQQIVLATVVPGEDGDELALRLRFWRNESTSRGEIERALGRAIGRSEEENGADVSR